MSCEVPVRKSVDVKVVSINSVHRRVGGAALALTVSDFGVRNGAF